MGVTEKGGPDRLPFSLRARKAEVLRLLAQGCSKRRAARVMQVSLSSIKRWARELPCIHAQPYGSPNNRAYGAKNEPAEASEHGGDRRDAQASEQDDYTSGD